MNKVQLKTRWTPVIKKVLRGRGGEERREEEISRASMYYYIQVAPITRIHA